jgi:hypothetical protein
MLKAGALLYVIFVSLVVSIITGALISLNYYKSVEISDYITIEKLNRNVNSGLNYLAVNPIRDGKDSIVTDLFDSGEDSVILKSETWGFYKKLSAEAKQGRFSSQKNILVGVRLKSYPALYLESSNSAFTLAGSSSIFGSCYLPSANISYSYIETKQFTGKELPKENIVPLKLFQSLIDKNYFKQIFDQIYNTVISEDRVNWDMYSDSSEIKRNFSDKTLVLISTDPLKINYKNIEGNIIIISSKSIYVYNESRFKDVILIAPIIKFEKNFKGTLQCIANDSIYVGESVVFEYPSILALMRNKKSNVNMNIQLSGNDSLNGELVLYDQYEADNKYNCISIKKSFVQGQIYSSGFSELSGTIYGSVITRRLTLHTSSSIYDNVLMDCNLNAFKISQYFVGGCHINNGYFKTVKALN